MVEIIYRDRLGNRIFQYCLGRIIAEELGFKLKAGPLCGFPNTALPVNGADYSDYPVQVIDDNIVNDLDSIISNKSKRKILINGYFQRYRLYRRYKGKIRKDWLVFPNRFNFDVREDDIVVCIRRDDALIYKYVVPFSYFEEALSRSHFRRVFICTDDVFDPFLLRFRPYHPCIQRTDTLRNFEFIKSFKKIIISASTYYWWAAFLSEASEIYMPMPLEGWWSEEFRPLIDLRITDEQKFILIPCREKYRITVSDKIITLIKKRVLL